MERNPAMRLPPAPPVRSVCCLVGLVELATFLMIVVCVLSAEQHSSDLAKVAPSQTVIQPENDVVHERLTLENGDGQATVETLTELERSMLGVWEDDYKGHRTLTLNANGTGVMVVELDGLASTLFASTLTFQEDWNVSDGKVTMKATGGEPAGKVQLVLSLHGDTSTQRIDKVTDDLMILVEEPSGTRFEWRRVRGTD